MNERAKQLEESIKRAVFELGLLSTEMHLHADKAYGDERPFWRSRADWVATVARKVDKMIAGLDGVSE